MTMIDQNIQSEIDIQIREHIHDGNFAQQVNFNNLFGVVDIDNLSSATIATTGNTDTYYLATASGQISQVDFSALVALAASNTNYITFTITNLGQDGSGTTAILASSNLNTTKTTGGIAILANTIRSTPFVLSTAVNASQVQKGDRLLFRAAATGTLANTVTVPIYLVQLLIT